jgi:CheY-like chemotaxis protein
MTKRLNLSKWHVLIVDDDEPNAMLAADFLRIFKANIYTALSGASALGMVRMLPKLTAILLDLKMPNMSGWELRDRLCGLPELASTPIIAMTAYAMEADRLRVFAAGFDGYIAKPILMDSFVTTLFAAISQKRSLRSYLD